MSKKQLITLDFPECFSPHESNLIDEDIKKEFKDCSYSAEQMIQMQMIKTMKELTKALNNFNQLPLRFDENGRKLAKMINNKRWGTHL